MSVSGSLFVWATPALGFLGLADHTWVTTYDRPFSCAKGPPPADYWYCWGDCHGASARAKERRLRTTLADLALARCIAVPNRHTKREGDPAHAGIDRYGRQGVCHQVANRILFAAYANGRAPTVLGAHGYEFSVAMFRVYGRNEAAWINRLRSCGVTAPPEGFLSKNGAADFIALANIKLGSALDPDTSGRLALICRSLRQAKAHLDQALDEDALSMSEFAAETNHMVDSSRGSFLAVLGPERYERLFGMAPEVPIALVDPRIAEQVEFAPEVPISKKESSLEAAVLALTTHGAAELFASFYRSLSEKEVLKPGSRRVRSDTTGKGGARGGRGGAGGAAR